ncbi:MAG: hypothetical protein A3E36_04460 [Candidatus Andersenbacteria bacterium RIFCSPHIGHO2_12_FULL_45_11b]|uniref:Phosphoribosylaminoimidazole-succinocarboxamide synthase n=1 Tax=Candidatus Andersenbacteria bacterium RIFCSPHIGHO2_12_FULL_45_11b TaxID=1797282 RepID=A0A1G1X9V7_9BACT|nr:MAG: hypothetical protein A3E36_04460 [Candidatus Andersenbacteria bacterium RIFCSPHIGHO2_12_FULL_45_11b]
MERAALPRIHQGKVRDTYILPDPNLLFVLATDRVSIFDFVLPTIIPLKGEVLTALTVFWLRDVLDDVRHHLIAYGKDIDDYLLARLRGDKELHNRGLVVRKLAMLPIECIVRNNLTGSGWKSYQKDKTVCGITLPPDLHDGSQLPAPIFTPTTKAETGHDEPLDAEDVVRENGTWIREQSLAIFNEVASYARTKGLILADTKFEFGKDGTLADEVATPDSSRYWDLKEWERACEKRETPPSYDKEIVRTWGKQHGVDKLDPTNTNDLNAVASLQIPQDVLDKTVDRYHEVFRRITGESLKEFQLHME